MIFKLPDLRELSVIFERDTPSPLAVLPNLTKMYIECDHNSDRIQVFHGAAFERLETVMFNYPRSEQIGDLETFERATLATSIQNTLSEFYLFTWCSWNPNYSSLLPFTKLTTLVVEFSCGADCSSRVDEEIIMNLAWAMPKLEILQLGDQPCSESLSVSRSRDLWSSPIIVQISMTFRYTSKSLTSAPRQRLLGQLLPPGPLLCGGFVV